MKRNVLFISSTGGHLNELMQLSPIFEKYDYHIITEKTKSNLKLKEKYPGKVGYLVYGTKLHIFTYIFKEKILKSLVRIFSIIHIYS